MPSPSLFQFICSFIDVLYHCLKLFSIRYLVDSLEYIHSTGAVQHTLRGRDGKIRESEDTDVHVSLYTSLHLLQDPVVRFRVVLGSAHLLLVQDRELLAGIPFKGHLGPVLNLRKAKRMSRVG